eukprot:6199179-Pleurochrysis_carterae.AAC.1
MHGMGLVSARRMLLADVPIRKRGGFNATHTPPRGIAPPHSDSSSDSSSSDSSRTMYFFAASAAARLGPPRR